jgi:hypothetical protein
MKKRVSCISNLFHYGSIKSMQSGYLLDLELNLLNFNLVQSITANRFLIKQKRYNGTHKNYT